MGDIYKYMEDKKVISNVQHGFAMAKSGWPACLPSKIKSLTLQRRKEHHIQFALAFARRHWTAGLLLRWSLAGWRSGLGETSLNSRKKNGKFRTWCRITLCRLVNDQPGSCSTGKHLAVSGHKKNMVHKAALEAMKANHILGCISNCIQQIEGCDYPPLF